MKTTRIIATLLAVIMLCAAFSFAGCGQKATVNAHVMFIDGEGNTIGDTTVSITAKEPPSVLQVAESALLFLDFEKGYEITADGYSIKAVNGIAEVSETDAENGYYSYWRAYVNGNETEGGRQSSIKVYNNAEVVFKYVSDSKPREDNIQYTDNTNADDAE